MLKCNKGTSFYETHLDMSFVLDSKQCSLKDFGYYRIAQNSHFDKNLAKHFLVSFTNYDQILK